MNRAVLALILGASIGLPTASAHATEYIYAAGLSGAQENPAVVTSGTGFTTVTYNDLLHSLRVQVEFSGLTGLTSASHIHVIIPPALNGGVATQTPTFSGFPLGVTSGTYDNQFDLTQASSWNAPFITANGGTTAGAEAAFFAALQSGRAYLNVHTNFAPGGEIRGALAAVPEVATWAMMLIGFFGLGAAMRRRRALPQALVSYA